MKRVLFSLMLAILTSSALAQEDESQGDFGEVFGIARSSSYAGDCEKPEPFPETRAEWEVVVAKIESGDINKATVAAFISGKMPKDLHIEALGRKYNAAHYAYVKAKAENPSTGCEPNGYAQVFGMYRVGDAKGGSRNDKVLPSTEELNAIWASMLQEVERQQTPKDTTSKTD